MAYWRHKTHPEEYNCWNAMRVRCRNVKHPYFHRYGGRGIKVCPSWDSFPQFLQDMGPRPSKSHSLERNDNDLGYSKDNCRWATKEEQSNNRTSFNKLLTAFDQTLTIGQWATEAGVPYHLLYARLSRGWPPELALTLKADASAKVFPKRKKEDT